MTRRIEFGPDSPKHLVLRTGVDLALSHLVRAAINDFLPLRFCVRIRCVIETGDKLVSQIGPVLFRQGQHFSDLFSGNAHAGKIATFA